LRLTVPSAVASAFLPGALAPDYLALMDRPDYDPFRTAIDRPAWRKIATLWGAARRI
jgi:phytoene synthase